MKTLKNKFYAPSKANEAKTVAVSLIDYADGEENEEQLKKRAAYFLLNGVPVFSVREEEGGRYRLLAGEKDFAAVGLAGITEVTVRVYKFSDREAEVFSLLEKLKDPALPAMEAAYAMKRLIGEYKWKQEDVARAVGKSRPAVANTLRLLTLAPEVSGLVESGKLSAGHARALVGVSKDKQYAFALEIIRRGYSVRETERAVKAFLTPPEVLKAEKAAYEAAKSAELKAFVEQMRSTLGMKVSLIGNGNKGRIYIDYFSREELYRLEEMLEMIETFRRE